MRRQTWGAALLFGERRSTKGQAVVEFTLGFILFYMILMSIVEFSHLLYTKINLQHAVSEAGRYMITGQGLDHTGMDPNARLKEVQSKFCNNLIATGLSCQNVGSHFSVSCAGGACSAPAGGPEQTVTLTVTYVKPWFSGVFNYLVPTPATLVAKTTWKNEKYL
jgi:Flp pilus assembly protein TadG